MFAWRPSMPGTPSFSFGASGFGKRARDAISVLDSILEENGTEDIPRGLIVGLFVFVGVMAVVALIVASMEEVASREAQVASRSLRSLPVPRAKWSLGLGTGNR